MAFDLKFSSEATQVVPTADASANVFMRDVVGQKSDAAVIAVGTSASIMAYLKGILNTVLATGTDQTDVLVNGPSIIDVDNVGHFEACLVDKDVGLIATGNITPGTYDLIRVRGGASTTIANDAAFSESTGRVYADITFAAANWAQDDAFKLVPNGDTSYAVGATTLYPPIPTISGMISDLSTIDTVVDGIATQIGTISNTTLADTLAASLGDLLDQSIATRLITLDTVADAIQTDIGDPSGGGTTIYAQCTSIKTATDQIGTISNTTLADTLAASLGDLLDQSIATRLITIDTVVDATAVNRTQVATAAITVASNAVSTALLTVGTAPVIVKSVMVYAVGGAHADLTNLIITDSTPVVTFIDAVTGVAANLAAAKQQVAWTGAVYLPVSETINIDPTGTGVGALNMLLVVEYEAVSAGGVLA